MRRTFLVTTALFLLIGCDRSPPPVPPVSTDTAMDLRHEHRHVHGEHDRHEHVHDDSFVGAHAHLHSHAHRHAPTPHGGIVLSLQRIEMPFGSEGLDAVQSESRIPEAHVSGARSDESIHAVTRLHLEVVLDLPQGFVVYFLTEDAAGNWSPWAVTAPKLTARIGAGSVVSDVDCIAQQAEGAYLVDFPRELRHQFSVSSESFRVTIEAIGWGGTYFTASENMLGHEGKLSVMVE